jgi:hypothetical protein
MSEQLLNSDKLEDIQDKYNALQAEFELIGENIKVIPQSSPDLTVTVQPGYYSLGDATFQITYPGESVDLTSSVPGSNSRIVLITLNGESYPTGPIEVVEGTIAASPVAPDYGNRLVIAEITLTNGQTTIVANDIDDVRPFWWANRDSLSIVGKEVDDTLIGDGKVIAYIASSGKWEFRTVSGLGGISISWFDLTDSSGTNYTGKNGYIPTVDEFYSGAPKQVLTDPATISVGYIDGNDMDDLDDRYAEISKLNEYADFEDYKRRNVLFNPTFSGWNWAVVSPYYKKPIGWFVNGADNIDVTDGYRGLGASIPATKEIWQYVAEEIVTYYRSKTAWMQATVKGVGYVRCRVTKTDLATVDFDVTFNSVGSFTSVEKEIAVPSNAKYFTIIVHSNSGTVVGDNVHIGLQKRTPASIFENYVRGKQLEFFYFAASPNNPGEGILNKAPIITCPDAVTSRMHAAYSIPEDYPGYCDLMLGIMAHVSGSSGGEARFRTYFEAYAGMTHGKTISNIDTTISFHWDYGEDGYKYFGIPLVLDAEPTNEMSFSLQFERVGAGGIDNLEETVNIVHTEIIPIGKDYS